MTDIRTHALALAKRASGSELGAAAKSRRRTTAALRAALMASVALASPGLIAPPARAGQDEQFTVLYDNAKYQVVAGFNNYPQALAFSAYLVLTGTPTDAILIRENTQGKFTYSVETIVSRIPVGALVQQSFDDPQTTLPPFSGSYPSAEVYGTDLGADGTVVVGFANYGGPDATHFSKDHAFRWTAAGGTVDIDGRDKDTTSSAAYAVSADGKVVAGRMSDGTSTTVSHAFRWTEASVMTDLGVIGGSGSSEALGISGDGKVLVGDSSVDSTSAVHAFRWTQGGLFQDLGTLSNAGGDYDSSFAKDASYDGSVVVGWSSVVGVGPEHAFRWTHAGGMADLGVLPGDIYSHANAVSDDGSVIVGTSTPDYDIFYTDHVTGNEHAFRWTQATGMANLKTLLSNAGLNMKGISLLTADGLSADGVAIVGKALMPGDTNPTGYLVTYIDSTNYAVAKKEGVIDAITSAFTTTSSVGVSMGELGDAQQALFSQEKTFNSLLAGAFDPVLGGGNHIGLTAAAGSTTVAIHGSGEINDHFTLFGGIGYGNRDYDHATVELPVTVAAGLRWLPEVMGAARPFAEIGGFVSPAQNDMFERVYANGSGTATGTGFTHSTLAEGYIKGGLVLTPTKKMQLALSADVGEGVFSYDGYSEASSSANPFPATVSGATRTATLVHADAKLNWTVNDHVKLGLNAGVGHSIGQARVSGTVAGSPYSATGGDISWVDYGADVGLSLNKRASLTAFVIGESGDKGTGSHLQAGGELKVTF